MQRDTVNFRKGFGLNPTALFAHPENGCLADGSASALLFLALVLIFLFAAEVGLVHFDNASEQRKVITARLTKTLKDEPCRLLSNPNLFGQLHTGDAFARGH